MENFEWKKLPVRNRGDFFLVGKNGFLIRQDCLLVGENFIQNGLVFQDRRLIVEQRFLIFQNRRLVAEDGLLIGYNFVIGHAFTSIFSVRLRFMGDRSSAFPAEDLVTSTGLQGF
jgi:hypothetical protein